MDEMVEETVEVLPHELINRILTIMKEHWHETGPSELDDEIEEQKETILNRAQYASDLINTEFV